MTNPARHGLSRRERQIMDVLYKLGRATAAEIMAAVPGQPTSSTIRTQLRVLERKGHVRHEEDGHRFVYRPTIPRRDARKSALRHLVETFYGGSAERVVAAVLGGEGTRVSDEELERIAAMIDKARSEARR
jgi:predicted transcriptional regulator